MHGVRRHLSGRGQHAQKRTRIGFGPSAQPEVSWAVPSIHGSRWNIIPNAIPLHNIMKSWPQHHNISWFTLLFVHSFILPCWRTNCDTAEVPPVIKPEAKSFFIANYSIMIGWCNQQLFPFCFNNRKKVHDQTHQRRMASWDTWYHIGYWYPDIGISEIVPDNIINGPISELPTYHTPISGP